MADCRGPLGGSRADRVRQGFGLCFTVLNPEFSQGLGSLNLSRSSVWWHGPLVLQSLRKVIVGAY